jgi:hypothetical protein
VSNHDDGTREWAGGTSDGGSQQPKPVGDTSRWRARDPGEVKNVKNFRRGIRHNLQKALENHDKVSADPSSSAAQIEESIQWLTAFYRRLYYLDKLHIMLEKPDGHPEYQIR